MKEIYSRKKLGRPINFPSLSNKLDDPAQLKAKIQKLHLLCANYDPYNKDIPEDIYQLLLEFHLDPQELDPFSLTEGLLVLLDQLTNLAKKIP